MDSILLKLEPRTVTGKAVKRLRADGLVPAVIHDHGKASLHVMAPYLEMSKAYKAAGKHHPLSLTADGKEFTALIKNVDFDPRKQQLRHVVFNSVRADEKVTAEVPVHIKYADGNDSSPAERAGLVVLMQLEAVEVEALPRNLPDFLEFDGEKLVAVGDHMTVADLIVPAGVTIKDDPTQQLAAVFEPSALQAANEAAAGAATLDKPEEEAAEGETAAAEAGADKKPEEKADAK